MKNSKPLSKRIIAGKYKGKILKLPSKTTTRSSKAIVLESFFNTLQFDIVQSHFVEMFAGSGSVGLEALSRGASKIYFMEKDKDALRVLKQNIAQTDPTSCEVYGGDSFENIKEVVSRVAKQREKAYFYIDPPFSIREGMESIYDKTMQTITSLPTEVVAMIIIEHMSTLEIPETLGEYKRIKTKKFGNTSLSYFQTP